MADSGFSKQDMQDLQEIAAHLPADDPRRNKLNLLLNSQPTNFEQERDPKNFKGAGGGFLETVSGLLKPQAQNPYPGMGQEQKSEDANAAKLLDDKRKSEGRSLPYRALAPVASSVGANVEGMEHAADVGDAGYIKGAAIGSSVPAIAPLGLEALGKAVKVPNRMGLVRSVDRVALGKATPPEILTRALKPPVTYPDFEKVVGERLPEISEHAAKAGSPIDSVNKFTNTVDDLAEQKNSKYQNLVSPYRVPQIASGPDMVRASGPFRPSSIDGSPIADAQMHSIPALDRVEHPGNQTFVQRGSRLIPQGDEGIMAKTAEKAAPFRSEFTVPQLDDVRVDTNAKLNSFYNKAGGDQHAALSNPETARIKAINDTSRNLVYDKIKNDTGVDPRPDQTAFGDYADLGTVSGKRGVVFNRQQPFPLQEQLNAADSLSSPSKFVMGKLFRRYGDSNSLTGIAMDRFDPSQRGPSVTPIANGATVPLIKSLRALSLSRPRQSDESIP